MKVAEFQRHAADPNDEPEWIAVYLRDGFVSIAAEYIGYDDKRTSWQDSGLAVDDADLDKLIDALQQARSARATGTDKESG